MSALAVLGILSPVAGLLGTALLGRHYARKAKESAQDADGAANDAYRYAIRDDDPDSSSPTPDADQSDTPRHGDRPTQFIPRIRAHYRDVEPHQLSAHGQRMHARVSGKHRLDDPNP